MGELDGSVNEEDDFSAQIRIVKLSSPIWKEAALIHRFRWGRGWVMTPLPRLAVKRDAGS
ncbi:hypothetical protein ACLOJK_014956 [Asimina triloba]